MAAVTSGFVVRCLLVLACASMGAGVCVAPADAQTWPNKVYANYKITFGGIEVGNFEFESKVQAQTYVLSGQAEVSAIFGAFKWHGVTRSSGGVGAGSPKPAAYTFEYRSNSRTGSVKMAFNEAGVSQVTIVPPSSPPQGAVPIADDHLKQVFDPMTAIMALTRGPITNPCGRRISIFDGRQRFDLVLSSRGQQRVAEALPSGQPNIAFVCRVRYIPISGHKNNDETEQMAANTSIEVALRPVPAANLFIPYRITIPTIAGSAEITSQRVEISTPGREPIALIY